MLHHVCGERREGREGGRGEVSIWFGAFAFLVPPPPNSPLKDSSAQGESEGSTQLGLGGNCGEDRRADWRANVSLFAGGIVPTGDRGERGVPAMSESSARSGEEGRVECC